MIITSSQLVKEIGNTCCFFEKSEVKTLTKEEVGQAIGNALSQVLQFIINGFKNMDFKAFFDEFIKLIKSVA